MIWRQQAACRGMETGAFFTQNVTTDVRKACEGCPVRSECLEAALARGNNEDEYGYEGGLSPNARRMIRRQRARGLQASA